MIAKNTSVSTVCIACLNSGGQKKVVDTHFEKDRVIVLTKCCGCGGVTKHTYELCSSRYISGPRKAIPYVKGD